MGIIQRQSLKYSALSFIGMLIGGLSTLLIVPNILEANGIKEIFLQTAITLYPISVLGGHLVSIRFFPYFKDKSKKHHGFLGFLLAMTLFGLIGIGIISLFFWSNIENHFIEKGQEHQISDYLFFLVPIVVGYAFSWILESYIKNFQRIAFPAFFLDFGFKVLTAILMFCYFKKWISLFALLSIFSGYFLVVILILLFFIYKLDALFIRFKWSDYLPLLKGELGRYLLFGAFGGIGMTLATTSGTTVFVGSLSTSAAYASVFAIMAFLSSVIEIPTKAILAASVAKVAECWRQNDMAEMQDLYHRVSINLIVPGVFVFLGIWLSFDSLMEILEKNETLIAGKYAFLFLGLGKIANMASGINNAIINYSKHYYLALIAMLVAGVTSVMLNVSLIPTIGVTGAGLATGVSFLLYNIINVGIVYRTYKLWPFSMQTLLVLFLGIISYLPASLIPSIGNPFLDILIRSVALTVLYGGLILWFKPSPDLDKMIGDTLQKVGIQKG